MAHFFDLIFQLIDILIVKETYLRFRFLNTNKRIRCYKFGFKVWQWPDTEVFLAFVRLLINNEGYKKTELTNLGSYWLYIHPVNAVFNQIKFTTIIQFITGKCSFNIFNKFITNRYIINGLRFFDLSFFPEFIFWIKFVQYMH